MAEVNGVLLERLKLLKEYKQDLTEFQSLDFEAYQENKVIRRAVERTFQIAIEACIDIGQRVIAAEDFRPPESNRHRRRRVNGPEALPSYQPA